jgi:prephenate dehydratase
MAKVEWSAGIDSVSGALSKPSKSGQHSCNKMLLGTHRVAATTSNKCNRLYLRKKVERSTAPSADEQAARQRFAVVSAQVAARKKNVATMSSDQAAFLAQKDQPGGKKTFVSYLWMVVGDAYDEQHNG